MNPAILTSFSSVFTTFVASFLIWLMFAGILVLWLIDGRIKKEVALHSLLASILGWVIAQVVKDIFPTIRPFQINGFPPLTFTIPSDGGFPSGHAALGFGLAVSIFLHNKKLGIIYIIAALLVCWGRIISNVHYFSDIMGGAIIGSFTAILMDGVHLGRLIGGKRS